MTLEEKHKEFSVKGYACFMKPSEILDDYIQKQLLKPTISINIA